jgi:hypothetical protein
MLPSGGWPIHAKYLQHCLSRPVSFRLFNPGHFRSSLTSYSDLIMLKSLHHPSPFSSRERFWLISANVGSLISFVCGVPPWKPSLHLTTFGSMTLTSTKISLCYRTWVKARLANQGTEPPVLGTVTETCWTGPRMDTRPDPQYYKYNRLRS